MKVFGALQTKYQVRYIYKTRAIINSTVFSLKKYSSRKQYKASEIVVLLVCILKFPFCSLLESVLLYDAVGCCTNLYYSILSRVDKLSTLLKYRKYSQIVKSIAKCTNLGCDIVVHICNPKESKVSQQLPIMLLKR